MKVLRLILQQVLVFLLAITALHLQAKNDFKFINKKNDRHTKIEVEKVEDKGRYYLKLNSQTTRKDKGTILTCSRRIDLNSNGTEGTMASPTGDGQKIKFSLMTRKLLIEKSNTGRYEPGYVLMPFGFFSDDTVISNGLLSGMFSFSARNESEFIVLGTMVLKSNEWQNRPVLVSVRIYAVFNPEDDQLTKFVIFTATGEVEDFSGELQLIASSEQGGDKQSSDPESQSASYGYQGEEETDDEQSVEGNPEATADDDQDEQSIQDHQPHNYKFSKVINYIPIHGSQTLS